MFKKLLFGVGGVALGMCVGYNLADSSSQDDQRVPCFTSLPHGDLLGVAFRLERDLSYVEQWNPDFQPGGVVYISRMDIDALLSHCPDLYHHGE